MIQHLRERLFAKAVLTNAIFPKSPFFKWLRRWQLDWLILLVGCGMILRTATELHGDLSSHLIKVILSVAALYQALSYGISHYRLRRAHVVERQKRTLSEKPIQVLLAEQLLLAAVSKAVEANRTRLILFVALSAIVYSPQSSG